MNPLQPVKDIVITKNENQARELHVLLGKEWNNIGFWGKPVMDYNKEWHWVIENKNIAGTSGYHSLENQIENNPGFKIFYFKDFKKMYESTTAN